MNEVPLAETLQPLPRIKDGQGFIMHWAGGLQSCERNPDQWHILPIQHGGAPHASGLYSRQDMLAFMRQRGARFVAYQQIRWTDGSHAAFWNPFIAGERNFHQSPADLWNHAARNLARARISPLIDALQNPTREQITAIQDEHGQLERLASSISLSLRNLDTTVSQIASFYHTELINQLAAGNLGDSRSSSVRDQILYAHVHGFFLHLGAARDYLAAFIAYQLGMDVARIDAMNRLVEAIRLPDKDRSAILQLLITRGFLSPVGAPSTKWKSSGWLYDATELRNQFTHHRTYGHLTAERMGYLEALDEDIGLYRYFRPVVWKGAVDEVFDMILFNYERVNELFFSSAKLSGQDLSILDLTDRDTISSDR